MSRILLEDINSLVFFSDSLTKGRRTAPIPQLQCSGSICKGYQPDAVSCINIGGRSPNVNWKCSADLPSSLRFGKIDVSCEGWSRPGDPYVLEGSCGLKYDLVKIHDSLRDDTGPRRQSLFASESISSLIFSVIFCLVFAGIMYSFLKTCFTHQGRTVSRAPNGNDGQTPGGWFSRPNNDPPPPYTPSKPSEPSTGGWSPGFWTGLGLGGIGAYLFGSGRRQHPAPYTEGRERRMWDWERPNTSGNGWFGSSRNYGSNSFQTRFTSPNEGAWSTRSRNVDRGEGSSSDLGNLRSSTGLGRSSVR